MKKPTWVPPTLWSPLDSPFLPVPDAPAQDLPCPSTRKTLVWASLFWIPARVPFCPETSLSSSGSHWFGHLDSCSGLPCSGLLSWIPPPFYLLWLTTSSPLCGRPFFYLSLVPAACCKWVMSQPCEQQQGKVASRVPSTEDIRSTEPATTEQTKLISLAIFTHQFPPPLSLSPPHPLFFLSACFCF